MAGHSDGAATTSTTTTPKRKPRKPRGRGLRTTTGCTVCRRRHLKCGEEKPRCGNCARGGRECVYGSARSDSQVSGTQNLSISDREDDSSTIDDAEQQVTAPDMEDAYDVPPADNVTQDQPYGVGATQPNHVYSPISTLSSTASQGPEAGPLRWFGMVATDYQNSQQVSGVFPSLFEHTTRGDSYPQGSPSSGQGFNHSGDTQFIPLNLRNSSYSQNSPYSNPGELPSWYADVFLKDDEIPIFQNFCERVADWLDVLDPMKHFASALPQLAMHNEGLMKAMLALSARHMSMQRVDPNQPLLDRTVALQYYHDTLQYLHNAMKHPEYLKSVEVNATSLILSTYEMFDGMGRSWIRHLKGVFWIQRSQYTNADSGGLKAAIWWVWLRQDTWAALREKRKVLTIYSPAGPLCDLDFWQHANFVAFIFAQCVSYMSDEEVQVGGAQFQERVERAKYLSSVLEEWHMYLPVNFKAIPYVPPGYSDDAPFKPIWIYPISFGTVLQMYQASRVILLAHAPAVGGFREFSSRNRQLSEAIDVVCGIAMTVKHGGSSIISTSCLWASGICTQDPVKREAIVQLLREHKEVTGWPITDLGEELRNEWAKWE